MTITPTDGAHLLTALKAAAGGDTLLIQGVAIVPAQTFKLLAFDPPIRLIGGQWAGARFSGCSGITIESARFEGPAGHGLQFDAGCKNIQVRLTSLTGFGNAIVIDHSSDVLIEYCEITQHTDDGIDGANCQRVTVRHNTIHNPNWDGIRHPDAIQFWSTDPASVTTDITIQDNVVNHPMEQGVTLFDKPANGGQGFDRIVIDGNDISAGQGNGLTLEHGRQSQVTNNRVQSLNPAAYSTIHTETCPPDLIRYGNVVAAWGTRPEVDD